MFVFSTRSSDTIYCVFLCFQHCCMFSERVLKNLTRSRRNAFLLRCVCISCVFLLPRLDLLVFYSVLGGRAYLRIFVTIRQDTYFSSITRACSDFQRFFVPVLLVLYRVYMTNHDFSTTFKRFVHILRIRDTFGAKRVKRATIIEQNKLSSRYKACICICV